MGGFFTALEDGGVAGFDGKGRDIGNDFGTGFEDDQQDTDGAGDSGQKEVVVQECSCRSLVNLGGLAVGRGSGGLCQAEIRARGQSIDYRYGMGTARGWIGRWG